MGKLYANQNSVETSPADKRPVSLNFTHQYSQPETYHFSIDSVDLARRVAEALAARAEVPSGPIRVLDLCAGCGVVGFELATHVAAVAAVDFIEVQEEYFHFFNSNRQMLHEKHSHVQFNWRRMNFSELLREPGEAFDLVISNPPYFETAQGRLPPDDLKARSRFFIDSSFAQFWRVVAHVLRPGGEAYCLVRDLGDHGVVGQARRELDLTMALIGQGEWEWLEPIRGTGLARFVKRR